MRQLKCDGDCFNCKFTDCILDYDEVPTDEKIDEFILDNEILKKREKAREKYRENREHLRSLWDKYYYSNKDKFKTYKHNYYIQKKDRILKQQSTYRENNRERINEERSIKTRLEKKLSKVKKYVEKLMGMEIKWVL